LGGVKLIAGEATLCIDMAGAPVGRWRGGSDARTVIGIAQASK
jgi:hypothetical protein